MPIWAHMEPEAGATNRRRSPRRQLRLDSTSKPRNSEAVRVAVRDLSLGGFLIETSSQMRLGEQLEVNLPEAGAVRAKVMWNRGQFFGCRFEHPISKAVLSAALLRSEPEVADASPRELSSVPIELQLVGADDDLADDRLPLQTALGLLFTLALFLWVAIFWLFGMI